MIRSKQSLSFETYWNTIRNGDATPAIEDFDPLQISDLIPNLFELTLPNSNETEAHIRFAGGDVVHTANQEVANTDFFAYMKEADVEPALARIRAVASQPCGLCQTNNMTLDGGSGVDLELTSFPVQCPDNDIVLVGTVITLEKEDSTDLSSVSTLSASNDRLWIDTGSGLPHGDFT